MPDTTWEEAGTRHELDEGHWHEPDFPSCVVCRMRELEAENAKLLARLADWDAMERANAAEAALREIAADGPWYAEVRSDRQQLQAARDIIKRHRAIARSVVGDDEAEHRTQLLKQQLGYEELAEELVYRSEFAGRLFTLGEVAKAEQARANEAEERVAQLERALATLHKETTKGGSY